jgi:hypothetical protein
LQLLKKEKSKKKFLLKINKAQIFDGRFVLTDENRENPKDLDFTKLNASRQMKRLHENAQMIT